MLCVAVDELGQPRLVDRHLAAGEPLDPSLQRYISDGSHWRWAVCDWLRQCFWRFPIDPGATARLGHRSLASLASLAAPAPAEPIGIEPHCWREGCCLRGACQQTV